MPRFSRPILRAVYGADYAELVGLLDFLDEHERAVEYDCLRLGLRLRDLGSERFSWGDLLVIVEQAPQDSAVFRSFYPDEAMWGLREQLLAAAVDALNVANWQRGSGKRKDYPKPIPRPGVEPTSKTYGSKPVPIDEMAEWLGWAA